MAAHYINRDFFQFRHDYLFDEVITNMPFQMGHVTEAREAGLYLRSSVVLPVSLRKTAS